MDFVCAKSEQGLGTHTFSKPHKLLWKVNEHGLGLVISFFGYAKAGC